MTHTTNTSARHTPLWRVRWAAAILALLGTALAPTLAPAHAAAPRSAVSDQVPPLCSWRNISSAAKGSTAFPEGAATTWMTYYFAHNAILLHIKGEFPYARFMSFTVQPISRADDGTITFVQTDGDRLYDLHMKAAKGSSNPFTVGVKRSVSKRHYDVFVRFQPPTGKAHGNTLYGGASGLGALSYRVYAPDKGKNALGGVPLPTIDKIIFHGDGTKSVSHVSLCSPISTINASALSHQLSQSIAHAAALNWSHSLSSSTSSPTTQDNFQGYDLLATRLPHSSGLSVVRFKAPSFAQTYTGAALTGREQVRYWSICEYELGPGRLAGCVSDDQANLDAQGYATIVLGDASQRPKDLSTLRTANWLPFGNDKQGVLIYRQLLPASSFTQSIARAPNSAPAMRSHMGAYYPTILNCTTARWSDNRCGYGR